MISVILPFYNAEQTLDEAIQSIVIQTFTQWELILVNNNSSDTGSAIAQAWVTTDPRITSISEDRQGVAYAMNTGLAHAKYPFIARMDADDISHPLRLQDEFDFLNANPDVHVVATRAEFSSELDQHEGFLAYVERQNQWLSHEEIFLNRFVDASVIQATTLIRKSTFERFGQYSTEPLPEDFELWLRWMHQGVRFAKLPQVRYTWRDGLTRLSRSHRDFSSESFDTTKAYWLNEFLKESHPNVKIICLGTSKLCQERAFRLKALGRKIRAFSDVSGKTVSGYEFIEPVDLSPNQNEFIISFISQRGTGNRIRSFLTGQGLIEGTHFLLTA